MKHSHKVIIAFVIIAIVLLLIVAASLAFYFFYWRGGKSINGGNGTSGNSSFSAAGSITVPGNNNWTKLVFTDVSKPYDNSSKVYNTSSGEFTASKDGFYNIGASLFFDSTGDATIFRARLHNITSQNVITQYETIAGGSVGGTGLAPLNGYTKLNRGDTIIFEVSQNHGASTGCNGTLWTAFVSS